MPTPIESLIAAGTKVWLDSIDPELVAKNFKIGATGATSNPIIIADLIKTGRFDGMIGQLLAKGHNDHDLAWALTDHLVREAQAVFAPVAQRTKGNDGYVSFELDPLLEDVQAGPPHAQRVASYVELGKKWAQGHTNRMIKVPATPAGLDALEALAAVGITLNVTLIFSTRQYRIAREAIWRGAQKRKSLDGFKSVYSIFVSRVDVWTEKNLPQLSPAAQGLVGLVNAKRIWAENKAFWANKKLPLQQEMIFASTGTKKPNDPADKYVAALAGSDIQTNPPATNDAVQALGKSYASRVAEMPAKAVLDEIDKTVDPQKMEDGLMVEGLAKFADPQKALLKLIGDKRSQLAAAK
ncbi:MAG: transaldolase [Planctomycetota bacterium]|nr:transaldolase [Planctomycetota bacterium]